MNLLTRSFLAVLVGACTSYDPNITNGQFRCAEAEPRCPEGFTCQLAGTIEVCAKGALIDGRQIIDAAGCTPEEPGLEPNDSLAQAFRTPIDTERTSVTYVGASVCPPSEADYFRFSVSAVERVRVDVTPARNTNGIVVRILNDSGAAVVTGGTVAGDDVIRAEIPNAAPGQYAAQVTSTAAGGYYDIAFAINP